MEPGSVVADRFEIVSLAGTGAMGFVYRATDRRTGLDVALKVLHPGVEEEERFEREARILEGLDHPGIVRYVAHGVAGRQERYLAIEWLEGDELTDRLEQGPLSIADSLEIGVQVARALAAAHAGGIVHRDIKPSNIVLCDPSFECVKVIDFSIARPDRAKRLTQVGTMLGTPAYMAPEQARGDAGLDARADVFSLGCVLFECLAGRPAFAGANAMAILGKTLYEEAPWLSELRPDAGVALEDLVARMLSKDPAERPRDGAAVVAELEDLIAGRYAEAEARPVPARRALGELTAGEQRLLSVVLAAPPETAGAGIGDPETLRGMVEQHGGHLDSLADGSIVATISGTGTATDQVLLAARCALAIRDSRDRDRAGPMALATGRGLVRQTLPVGEVIDRAALMLDKSTAGKPDRDLGAPAIRVDDVTAGLLHSRFEVGGDEAGLYLQGEHDPAVRRLLGRPTPTVGRDRELTLLEMAFDECRTESSARVMLLTAPAGAGKTRLCHELVRRLEARESPVEIWLGRGDPMSAGSPFGLLATAIRHAAAIVKGEPLAVRRRKLKARVARHLPAGDVDRVGEFLGEVAGIPFSDDDSVQLRAARQIPTLMGDQKRRAFEDFLAAECAAQPLVLVLEDLHWGDIPTIRFIDGALAHLRDRRLLVLASTRPEASELYPNLWADRGLVSIALAGLPAPAAQNLVRAVLGLDTPEDRVRLIVERAEGNAFYLEELIRAFAEGKREALPETVLAMLQVRLEALRPAARRVLRAASVFGHHFWHGGVAALLGDEPGPGSGLLSGLVESELVERRATSRFPGQEEYIFRQTLVREAAYAMLTDEDRSLGHRLAGAWLAEVGESDATVLAEHFDRGGQPEHALGWFRRGAEQALEGHDFAAAISRAEQGRKAGAEDETAGALYLVQAKAHGWRGELGEARGAALEATRRLTRGSALWLDAMEEAINASGRCGDYTSAAELAKEAAAITVSPAARSAQIMALCSAARQLYHAGHYDIAAELIERVDGAEGLARAPESVEPRALAEVYRLRGARARHQGALAGDVAGYEASLRAYEEVGDARNACNARISLGFAYIELGDYAQARKHLEEGLAEAERMGLGSVATRGRQNLGVVLAIQGQLEEACALETRAIAESRAQGNRRFESLTRIYLSGIKLRLGELRSAEHEAWAAAELLTQTSPARAGALAAMVRARLAQRRVPEARRTAAEAMQVLETYGGIEEFEACVRLAHAEAAHAAGDLEGARSAIATARDRLVARSAEIPSAGLRFSFLHNVPDNARTLELAAAWLDAATP